MSASDLDRRLATFFDATLTESLPFGLLDDVYAVTRRMPQQNGRAAAVGAWWSNPFGTASRLRILAVAALLLIALLATLTYVVGHSHRIPPPFGPAANGRIVYDVDGQLIAVEADGSSHALDVGSGHSWSATFSPDGTRMAFWSRAADLMPLVLFVANADGSDARPINGAGRVVGGPLGVIAWSPDGTRIAFASAGDDGNNAISIAAVDGSGTKAITQPDGVDRNFPAWSPGGDLIAWRRTPARSQESDLVVAAPDGSGERRLVTSQAGGAVFAAPQWSPDGSRLAYARLANAHLVAAIVDLRGHEEVLSEPWEEASPPAWSNDGTRLAYSRYPSGAAIVDVASDAKTELPTGLAECGIGWSPDDTTLLGLGADCHHGVYRIPVAHPDMATRISQLPGEVVLAGWQRVAP